MSVSGLRERLAAKQLAAVKGPEAAIERLKDVAARRAAFFSPSTPTSEVDQGHFPVEPLGTSVLERLRTRGSEAVSRSPAVQKAWTALTSAWAYPPPPGERVETEGLKEVSAYATRTTYANGRKTDWDLVTMKNAKGEVVAVATPHVFETANGEKICVVEQLAIKQEVDSKKARAFVEEIIQKAFDSGATRVCCEYDIPSKLSPAHLASLERRTPFRGDNPEFLKTLGFKAVDARYVQPGLTDDASPLSYVGLAIRNAPEAKPLTPEAYMDRVRLFRKSSPSPVVRVSDGRGEIAARVA